MKAQTFLFVGGEHHGKMLPISEKSLAAFAAGDSNAELRGPGSERAYVGYRLYRFSYGGRGCRIVAMTQPIFAAGDTVFLRRLSHALFEALDNYERVLTLSPPERRVPLNVALDDEPETPGKRRPTKADLNG